MQRRDWWFPVALLVSAESYCALGFVIGFSSGRTSPLQGLTQVISDVDDTLKSSGGVKAFGVPLGGIDVQYPRGVYYPGVAEFMLQISLSNGTTRTPPNVAILTARAEEFKVFLELKPTSKLALSFQRAGERANVPDWGLGPVLYGSVAEWIIQVNKGRRKFSNFEKLNLQDEDGILSYVYVGDTGELDQEAGETMLREYPELVKAVFLHAVSDVHGPVVVPPPHFINGRPMIFFRTYVGAALAAVQLQLMDLDGLQKVIDAAKESLAEEPQTSSKWMDLNSDISRANELLQ